MAKQPETIVQPTGDPAKDVDGMAEVSDTATPAVSLEGIREVERESGQEEESEAGDQAVQAHSDPSLTSVRKYILALTLSLSVFLVAMDQTIVTSSLPYIIASLNSSAGYTWIGTSYLLCSCSVLPLYGKLADIVGRKPTMLVAVGLFFIGSAVCGSAPKMGVLIAGRCIQGLGGGGISGLVNIIISDVVPLHERGLFIGCIGATWAIASTIGPLIGGALTTRVTWRWCFYINLPISGVCFIVLVFILKVKSPKVDFRLGIRRIDWLGVILVSAATTFLLLALDWGGVVYAWSSAIVIVFLVLTVVFYVLFFGYEYYIVAKQWTCQPLIPVDLFKDRTRAISLWLGVFHSITFLGVVYYLPFYLQALYGYNAVMASVILIPESILMGVASGVGGTLISKFNLVYPTLAVGYSLTIIGTGLLSLLNANSNTAMRILFPMVLGIGIGPNFQSSLLILQSRIKREQIAVATSTWGYVRTLGMSLGIAIAGVIFQNRIGKATADAFTDAGSQLSLNNPNSILQQVPESIRSTVQTLVVGLLAGGSAPASVNKVNALSPETLGPFSSGDAATDQILIDNIRLVTRDIYSYAFNGVWWAMCGFGGAFLAMLALGKVEMRMRDSEPLEGPKDKTLDEKKVV